jgi:hypothetical protein
MHFVNLAPALAAAGVPVFPCSPENKHPLIPHGHKGATTDPDVVARWARAWPGAWVGMPTGPASGYFVVDLDVKNGKDGTARWAELVKEHGDAPTKAVLTAGGGVHLYYRGDGPSTVDALAEGVDTRGDGGYVIVYDRVILDLPPAPVPEWVASRLEARAARRGVTAPAADIEKRLDVPRRALTREDLEAFAASAPAAAAADARAVLEGRPFGRLGGRDEALTQLVWWLVRKYPDLDPDPTADLFEASCQAVEDEDDRPTDTDWVARKFRYALPRGAAVDADRDAARAEAAAIVALMRAARPAPAGLVLGRADVGALAKNARPEVAAALRDLEAGRVPSAPGLAMDALARAAAASGDALDVPGTAEALGLEASELEAVVASLAALSSASAAAHDWLVGTPQGYFLRAEDGYQGPFQAELVPTRARDVLEFTGLPLSRFSRGEWAPKNAATLLHEYGKVPLKTEFTLVGETRLEADTFLYRALTEPELEPEFNEQIAHWLELLAGGPGPLHEALLDWLATFRQFDRPTCALFLKAWPGVGKGLLTDGIAAMFGGHAVPFHEAIGAFNGAIAYSPWVVADEALSAPLGVNGVDELKKLVGDSTFRVADKNVRAATLRGSVRVMLTSNHNGGFKFGRELTEADVAALDQRVLLLEPLREAADYLTSIGGRNHTEAWVQGRGIARHVRHLEATRKAGGKSRFLVEGLGGLGDLLTGTSLGTAPILRACLTAVLTGHAAVVRKGKRFWVHKKAVLDAWETLNKYDSPPDDMESAWGLICEPGSSTVMKEPGKAVRRCQMRVGNLVTTAARFGLSDELVDRCVALDSLEEKIQ